MIRPFLNVIQKKLSKKNWPTLRLIDLIWSDLIWSDLIWSDLICRIWQPDIPESWQTFPAGIFFPVQPSRINWNPLVPLLRIRQFTHRLLQQVNLVSLHRAKSICSLRCFLVISESGRCHLKKLPGSSTIPDRNFFASILNCWRTSWHEFWQVNVIKGPETWRNWFLFILSGYGMTTTGWCKNTSQKSCRPAAARFVTAHTAHCSVPLLQVYFSNNDFLGVRVRFFWH